MITYIVKQYEGNTTLNNRKQMAVQKLNLTDGLYKMCTSFE